MSDPDPTTPDEQVRRLLAAARVDEPMPEDVAVRLDGVLADLQGEARRTPAPVELAARRRRRTARNVLVAAAAVVVVGVGVGVTQVDLSGGDGDAVSSEDAGGVAARESAPHDADAGGDVTDGDVTGGLNRLVEGRPLVLTPDDFERQARRLGLHPPLESLTDMPLAEGYSADAESDPGAAAARVCTDPAWGAGELVRVRYDGKPGVLVLRTPVGDSRVVDLYLCGETSPARSATVPAR